MDGYGRMVTGGCLGIRREVANQKRMFIHALFCREKWFDF